MRAAGLSDGSVKSCINQSHLDLLENISSTVTASAHSLDISQSRQATFSALWHPLQFDYSIIVRDCMQKWRRLTRHCLLQRMQNQQKAAERKAKKAAEGGKALAKRGRKKCDATADEDESEREGESILSTSMTLKMLSGLSWRSAVLCFAGGIAISGDTI